MLSRAVVPLLRQSASAVRPLANQQARNFANKSGKPSSYKPPPSSNTANQKYKGASAPSAGAAAQAASRKTGAQSQAASEAQEEKDLASSSSPGGNDVPQSEGAGPGVSQAASEHPSSQPDVSKAQDEFNASASSEATTVPETDPTSSRQKPLPDLTQGIPSTIDAELARNAPRRPSESAELDITEEQRVDESAGGGGGRELPRSAYETSMDRRRNRMANYAYGSLLGLGVLGAVYLGRDWESEEEKEKYKEIAPQGSSPGLFYSRAKTRLSSMTDYYTEPAFPKLLPAPQPEWERPYTLVLSLEDLLIHSEWTREHGWRVAKRPGVDYFIRYLSQYYELVIWTSQPFMAADPIIKKLDPFHIVLWPLFREACRSVPRFHAGEDELTLLQV